MGLDNGWVLLRLANSTPAHGLDQFVLLRSLACLPLVPAALQGYVLQFGHSYRHQFRQAPFSKIIHILGTLGVTNGPAFVRLRVIKLMNTLINFMIRSEQISFHL